MKKLNRKGFTLIELLAIIVILAIIMVVTIPTILNATSTATEKQLKNAADSIEKWVSDQYILATVGQGTAPFTNVCKSDNAYCTIMPSKLDYIDVTDTDFVKAAGVVPGDFVTVTGKGTKGYVHIKVNAGTNRVCVRVKASTTGSFGGVTSEKSSNGC